MSITPQRPARESEIPCCNSNRFEPVKIYISCLSSLFLIQTRRCSSITFLISSSRAGAFWISSIISGQPYVSRNSFGFWMARLRSSKSSSVTLRKASPNIWSMVVDFPTCLGPYNTMQGNDLLTSRIMDSLLRSTYMLISPFSIKNALRCHFHRNAIITYFSDEINIAMSFSSKIKMYPLFRIVQQ